MEKLQGVKLGKHHQQAWDTYTLNKALYCE